MVALVVGGLDLRDRPFGRGLVPGVDLGDLILPTELTVSPPEFEEAAFDLDSEPTIVIQTPAESASSSTHVATESPDFAACLNAQLFHYMIGRAPTADDRCQFETMLADSDPDRMQEEFDRQIAKVSLPLMPAKMRYWDLYREKRLEMKKDPEAAFARLFGEEFARAYEEQFRELRAQRRARAGEPSKEPRPPQP